MTDEVEIKPRRKGGFQKGCKPGPGRPRGISRSKKLADVAGLDISNQKRSLQMQFDALPELTEKLLNIARGGDMAAIKLVFEKVLPSNEAAGSVILEQIKAIKAENEKLRELAARPLLKVV